MGVDTWLRLPAQTKIGDVAKAIAILLGRSKTWTDCSILNNNISGLTKPTKSGWVDVAGITFESSSTPECATICIEGIGNQWWLFYHFESEDGSRLLGGRCRGERIALHIRLAKLFGGRVDYNDCDSKSVNFSRPAPKWSTGEGNKKFHQKHLASLWNLQPLTEKEIQAARKYSAYDPIEKEVNIDS